MKIIPRFLAGLENYHLNLQRDIRLQAFKDKN